LSGEEDATFVTAYRHRRDQSAFLALYRRHTPRMFRLAWRLVGEGAEEAVQEAWVRAARGLDRFRGEARFGTWLGAILVNVCRELQRAMPRAGVPATGETPASMRPPEESVDLERAITALPPGQRAVLLLHDVEGHTHEEIAELLGVEPGTSKSQLFRARRAVRERLGRTP
jgi:RNA polymerase sigma-70 factor (ECF subfamily)